MVCTDLYTQLIMGFTSIFNSENVNNRIPEAITIVAYVYTFSLQTFNGPIRAKTLLFLNENSIKRNAFTQVQRRHVVNKDYNFEFYWSQFFYFIPYIQLYVEINDGMLGMCAKEFLVMVHPFRRMQYRKSYYYSPLTLFNAKFALTFYNVYNRL